MSGDHGHPEYATTTALADLESRVAALEAGAPDPTPIPPDPVPPSGLGPFRIGVLAVQNESDAGRKRIADAGGRIFGGQHYSAFGANCSEPTNALNLMKALGSVPKMLYSGLAPADLDVNGKGCAGSASRPKDVAAARTLAQRELTVAGGDPKVVMANWWNEWKGMSPSQGQLFCDLYIAFAEVFRANRPDIKLIGPYTTGGYSDAEQQTMHQAFIDRVVKPRPELVDGICWDAGDGSKHAFYTNLYSSQGIVLPHWNVEWYPGGWNPSSAPAVSRVISDLMGMACNDLMAGAFTWGSGSDTAMKAKLWDSAGNPTPTWTALVTASLFLESRPIRPAGTGWTNAAGKTLTVSGSTVTVS